MDDKSAARDDVPDLPDELDGISDKERPNAPPAIQDPNNPDAHGPLIRA
ncbi:hypothetical protein [Cellulomonas sp. P5_C6]